jgi:NAD(P)-dependent dehydrogenase (short-subunit alcohol dehydrogenase family)
MKTIMKGKTCLITGANSGIGRSLCLALASYGARTIMICRSRMRGQRALDEIKEKSGNPDIDLLIMDLSSQKSIRSGVNEFKNKYDKLDVLINNAGVLLFKKIMTEDDLEATLATNYLGPFLLTNLLLDTLTASAPARIINVVSEGMPNKGLDLKNLTSDKKYKPVEAYTQSKQAEILFTFHLAAKLKGTKITANCFYPGLVKTNLGKAEKGFHNITYKMMTALLHFLFTPLEESIKIGIFLAAAEKAGNLNGKFLKKQKNKIIAKYAYDKQTAKSLWDLSSRLTHLNDRALPEPGV